MEKTLLVLAAGMGSRFGGLKQIEPIGPHGEFIIDYSIYDALMAGFNKVVFVIKEENFDVFRDTIGNRISKYVDVCYVFQDIDNLPLGYSRPLERIKPWGTAHAIMCAKDYISGNFAVINADDFYGRDAFFVISKFLDCVFNDNMYGLVGYMAKNVLSDNGPVKRGVCFQKDNFLTKIVESSVLKINDLIVASPLSGESSFNINDDTLISMNMIGFNTSIFGYIEDNISSFLDDNKDDILDCEYCIPVVLFDCIKSGFAKVKVLSTTAKWHGITYKEDKELVVREINDLIEEGIYPSNLWD